MDIQEGSHKEEVCKNGLGEDDLKFTVETVETSETIQALHVGQTEG